MTILIDMDGTICTEEKTFERYKAKPLPGAIESMQRLADQGHTLVIYTSRTWAELPMTTDWLNKYNVPFHGIHCGKPVGDLHIDDRALRFTNWEGTLQWIGKEHK